MPRVSAATAASEAPSATSGTMANESVPETVLAASRADHAAGWTSPPLTAISTPAAKPMVT